MWPVSPHLKHANTTFAPLGPAKALFSAKAPKRLPCAHSESTCPTPPQRQQLFFFFASPSAFQLSNAASIGAQHKCPAAPHT
jgi:hypothetical protein